MATNPNKLLVGVGSFKHQWGGDGTWKDSGGFRDSLSIRFSEERFNLEVADHLAYVKSARTRLDVVVNTSLVENTFTNFGLATGTSTLSTTATSHEINAQGAATINNQGPFAIKFTGTTTGSLGVGVELQSWIFSQCVPITDTEISYQKDGETLIPVSFMVLGTVSGAACGFGFVDSVAL
jgi:hypothetical protein